MRPFEEHELMAYADGELPAAEAEALADAARQNPELARRIERYAATRRVLANSFAGQLEQPVPQRFLDLLAAPATVVPMARTSLRRRRRWLPLALAASVLLVVSGLSLRLLQQAPDRLSVALENTASGVPQPVSGGEIVALSTLQTAAGAYCREYERVAAGVGSRGLACREGDGRWSEREIPAAGEAPAQEYQTATGEGTDAAAALQARRLTAEEERKLIEKNWR